MSDLQCAATLLVVGGGSDADPAPLAEELKLARVASLYAADGQEQPAETLAGGLGLTVRRLADLETDARGALGEVVDLHRGETVLVVVADDWLVESLPGLLTNVPDDFGVGREAPAWSPAEVAADADGWVLRRWAGEPVGTTGENSASNA